VDSDFPQTDSIVVVLPLVLLDDVLLLDAYIIIFNIFVTFNMYIQLTMNNNRHNINYIITTIVSDLMLTSQQSAANLLLFL